MKHSILPNGNLLIEMEEGDKDEIAQMVESNPDDRRFLDELLDHTGWTPNGALFSVAPEDVAALTAAPIITDDKELYDSGKVTVRGDVWWYPNYAITHFGQELLDNGKVIFTKADPA